LGAQWNWQKSWPARGGWNITGFWDALIGHWHGRESVAQNRNIVEVGGGPVFRLSPASSASVLPFLEYGFGFRLLSRTRINRDREFSTAFQFANHIGAGVRFGPDRRYDLMLRFQHISNASIKKPNDGINLSEVRLAYHF
jgi:lipid A 3-O-deacylase